MRDYSNVVNSAKAVTSQEESGYKYPLLYPSAGHTRVKLLFNYKSNTLMRLVRRHTALDGKTKITCPKTYSYESSCPVCDAVKESENATGLNLWKYSATARGIAFAQFVEADHKVPDNVNKGSIVLLMFPWSVYKKINEIISDNSSNPENLAQLIDSNQGKVFDIFRSDGKRVEYSVAVDPFTNFNSCNSDAEFVAMMEDIDNLNDQVCPAKEDSSNSKELNQLAKDIRNQFLNLNTNLNTQPVNLYEAQPNATQQVTNLGSSNLGGNNVVGQRTDSLNTQTFYNNQPSQTNQPIQPIQPTQTNQTSQSTQTNNMRPECFGSYSSEDKCKLCPEELQCLESSAPFSV